MFDPRLFLRFSRPHLAERGWTPLRDLYRLASPAVMRLVAAHYAPRNEAFRLEYFPGEPAPLLRSRIPDDYPQLTEDACVSSRSVELLAGFLMEQGARQARRSLRLSSSPVAAA
jgi:hypothetical protein